MINDEAIEPDMSVEIGGVRFKNPVMTASGTFGAGQEYSEFIDIGELGAVVTKGVADHPWAGNPAPRIAEVTSGMLNAIGLQNPGVDVFIKRDLPFLKKYRAEGMRVIANVCGHSEKEYLNVVDALNDRSEVDMLEINISCPNVKEGGISFGTSARSVEKITRAVRRHSKKPFIMKLSPNVTSISEIAKAAEAGGADAVSLINTITGMKIDVERQTFVLANKTGGLSGPAVHPVAVRMVYEVHNAVKIPIIGMGGIENTDDAVEMMLAGASCIAIGTANFKNPYATIEIIKGIREYMIRHGIYDTESLIGAVR